MHFVANLLFFVGFLIKEIAPTSTPDSTSKYNLTQVLNGTITGIFLNTDFNGKAREMLSTLSIASGTYKISNIRKLKPFGDKIFFNNIAIYNNGRKPENKYCDFITNKTVITFKDIEFEVNTDVCIELPKRYTHFEGYVTHHHLSITATRLPTKKDTDDEIRMQISHGDLSNLQGNRLKYCDEIPYKKQQQIIYTAGMMLPSLLIASFANPQIKDIFKGDLCRSPRQKIISAHSDFLENEQHYYYHIPAISLVYLTLQNIKIRGLSNFQSYVSNTTFGTDGYTLTIQNIRGELSLDHGFKNVPILDLNFTAGHLYVTLDFMTEQISVEARKYSIIQTSSESEISLSSWLSEYSGSLMEQIESAIAHSLMPSMSAPRTLESSFSSNIREMERAIIQLLKNVKTT